MKECKYAIGGKVNEIGETLCFCELTDRLENVTLGNCIGNCDAQEEGEKMIKPILFNTEMVQAILDYRKTATRRCVKPQPNEKHQSPLGYEMDSTGRNNHIGCFGWGIDEYGGHIQYAKPPCKIGDILYVRETWKINNPHGDFERNDRTAIIEYKANGEKSIIPLLREREKFLGNKWNPSLFMPKEVARIFLKVTDVRIERLQDMKIEDISKEGFSRGHGVDETWYERGRKDFSKLWDSTIDKKKFDVYGWNANPWVWVIDFKRCEKPDELN